MAGWRAPERCTLRGWPLRAYGPIGHGDNGTLRDTVPWMRRLVKEGAAHPLVRKRALEVVRASPELHPIDACFRFVQSMPYVRDEALAERAGLQDTSEIVQGAPWQLQLEAELGPQGVEGDCDCRSVLLNSMLEALGYETSFVLVRGPGRRDFSHVYSEARLEDGRKVPLDTIMDGKGGRPRFRAGQEVGSEQARGRKVIPVNKSKLPVALLALGAGLLLAGGRG